MVTLDVDLDVSDRRVIASTVAGLAAIGLAAIAWQANMGGFRCPPRTSTAKTGAETVRAAAEIAIELEGERACPTIEGLVRSKLLAREKTLDGWGVPYRIHCFGKPMRVRVASSGPDRQSATVDDVVVVSPAALVTP